MNLRSRIITLLLLLIGSSHADEIIVIAHNNNKLSAKFVKKQIAKLESIPLNFISIENTPTCTPNQKSTLYLCVDRLNILVAYKNQTGLERLKEFRKKDN